MGRTREPVTPARVAAIEGMSMEAEYALPAGLATLLRSWVSEHRGEDIAAGLTGLERAIQADRQQVERDHGR
jgi:hypothetical protein